MDIEEGLVEWMDEKEWLDHRERVARRHFADTLHMSQQQALESEKRQIDLYFKGVAVKAKLVDSIVEDHISKKNSSKPNLSTDLVKIQQ